MPGLCSTDRAGRDTSDCVLTVLCPGAGLALRVVLVVGALRGGDDNVDCEPVRRLAGNELCPELCPGILRCSLLVFTMGILSFLNSFCRRGFVIILVFANSCGGEFAFSAIVEIPNFPLFTMLG